jgi:hypothetical protein
MDRDSPIGNSVDDSGRRGLHVIPQGGATGIKPYDLGRISTISVNHSAWVAAPSAALENRKSILIQNTDKKWTLLWNYTNDPANLTGYEIGAGGIKEVSLSSSVQVYVRIKEVTTDVTTPVIEELA